MIHITPEQVHIYHLVRAGLELLYFAAGVGLLFVACKALGQVGIAARQLRIAAKQARIAKRDIAIRVEREAAKETSVQLDIWATRIIPASHVVIASMREAGAELKLYDMDRFDYEELRASLPAAREQADKVLAKLRSDSTLEKGILDVCNLIEASAMCFMKGVANEELAFQALSHAYCQFVQLSYPLFCSQRKTSDAKLNRWENTISLYRKWSTRREAIDLAMKQQVISENLAAAAKDSVPVQVIGSEP